jgi:RNA polymerase sigma factor (sigma-70 family)
MTAEGQRPQVMDHLNLVEFWAIRERPNAPRSMTLRDLINAGVVGLIDACRLFDSNRLLSFSTYAGYRIRGEMRNEMRRFGVIDELRFTSAQALDSGTDENDEPLEIHQQHITQDALPEDAKVELPVMVGLNAEEVWILWRRYISGATCKEIAADLGCPVATLKWRIKQLIERLRRLYDGIIDHDGGGDLIAEILRTRDASKCK